MNVLIIEDDAALRTIIVTILEDEHFTVDQAADGEEGYLMATADIYDLLIVDIMLPERNGISVIKKLREEHIHTPTLILTAKDSIEDKVKGLNVGADDYIVKPFASQELIARIHSILRRAGKMSNEGKITFAGITLDTQQHQAFTQNESINLTIKEFELLHYFVTNQKQILTRSQIFDRIWGLESDTGEGIVDLYIHYLRKKLTQFERANIIRTIRGVGYKLQED